MQPTPAPVPTPAPAVPDAPAPVSIVAPAGFWAKLGDDIGRNPTRAVSLLLVVIAALTGLVAMIRGVPISSLPAVPIVAGAAVQHDAPMVAGAVLERRSFTDRHRLQLHRALQRIARNGTPEQKAQVAAALASEDAMRLVESRVEAQVVSDAPQTLKTGKLTDFFQWLLDHAGQIMALIQEVLKLLHIVP